VISSVDNLASLSLWAKKRKASLDARKKKIRKQKHNEANFEHGKSDLEMGLAFGIGVILGRLGKALNDRPLFKRNLIGLFVVRCVSWSRRDSFLM